jgi:glycine amidinotransferase
MHVVHSYDEWTRLREIVVGSGENTSINGMDLSFKLFHHDYLSEVQHQEKRDNNGHPVINQQREEELCEDIEGFITTLRQLGINVKRPLKLTEKHRFATPYWESTATSALNLRDQCLILGDEIIETPPLVRSRYFENDLLKPTFIDYFDRGAKWSVMPKPMMLDKSFDLAYVKSKTPGAERLYPQENHPYHAGYEFMFDAAQCIRFGKDVLINVANENHHMAFSWLERHLEGKFNLHKVSIADNHIDSIIMPLRPGTMLLRDKSYLPLLPKPLQKWDVLYPPEPGKQLFPHYNSSELILTSKYIDLNILVVDGDKVIVNSAYEELTRMLEKNGFTPIPVQHRHRRLFGGGFHCFTLDTVRDGGCEDYFS